MKGAVEKADKLFSELVRARGACENCGSTEWLQCAHGFSRRYRHTRWDLRNAFCLCRSCHVYFTHRPIEWDEWMRDSMGSLYEPMRRAALSTTKVDVDARLMLLRDLANAREAAS